MNNTQAGLKSEVLTFIFLILEGNFYFYQWAQDKELL